MKYYIIAGEASGDLHGSNLIKSLKVADSQMNVRCWGGDLMQAEGAVLVKHYRETAFMGVFEVIANAKAIKKNFQLCHQDILAYQPDVVILIDYPGFNLRIARFAKEHHLNVYYYISPKVWVWKESRVKTIKKYVDKMFVIFPFEKPFYAKHDYQVEYEGNPLIDAIEDRKLTLGSRDDFQKQHGLDARPIIALLPGSRKQEVSRLLPILISITKHFSEYQFVVAGTSVLGESFYKMYLNDTTATVIYNQTYELLNLATAAVVVSGTATLETALFNVPQVVCYSTNPASYAIARIFVNIRFFSLVNIVMEKEVVKEFLQKNLKRDIQAELFRILNDEDYRNTMKDNYAELRSRCGGRGASKRVGELMVKYLKG